MDTQVKDIDGHLLCEVNAVTGRMRNIHHNQVITIRCPIGGEIEFVRRGIYTVLKRCADGTFYVYGQHLDKP